MKSRQPVIAVFDVGKTNKKLLVFDADYNVVSEDATTFEEEADDEGFPCENIDMLTTWMLHHVQLLQQSTSVDLKAVNFSTYGASLLYLDAHGQRIAPLYNYLKPYPDELLSQFYASHGDKEKISVETCSPVMGHLNAGLQLYWLKHRRTKLYDKLATVLHFPQYLSYQLTGQAFADMTYVGCHSVMWNFREKSYHRWLENEGIQPRLCKVTNSNRAVKVAKNENGDEMAVGIGLHDSSAAIIPYLASFNDPFVIVSTGTWTISLNPFNNQLPQAEDLAKGCLSYQTYEGDPVRISMLFAGHHHDQQAGRIAEHFNVQPGYFKAMQYEPVLVKAIHERTDDESIIRHSRQLNSPTEPCVFHLRHLSEFRSAEEAYHCLVVDIIRQQTTATRSTIHNTNVKKMYVDGGFCKNSIYMQLLSDAFPQMEVYSSSMVQGTALGAALAIHHEWNAGALPDTLIKLKHWPKSASGQYMVAEK